MKLDSIKKPNLFIVGEPKSGTTALNYFLKQHPEIFLPEQKDLYHFAKDLQEERLKNRPHWESRFNYTLEQYLAHFKYVKDEKIIGDVTPVYLRSKSAAQEIYQFNPDAKIIAIFREPVDFLYSLHSQLLSTLNENEKDFKKALELEHARKQEKISLRTPGYRERSALYYSEYVKYAEQLKRYTDIFPTKHIQVLLFDDFKRDNKLVYREILEFLDVDPSFVPEFKVYNPNKVPRFKLLRALEFSALIRTLFLPIFPKSILPIIRNVVHKITLKYESRKPLNQELRQHLMKKYKPEVVALNELLHEYDFVEKDRNLLNLWGYDEV